jgi:peptide/nickel transport system substrate-binding protein
MVETAWHTKLTGLPWNEHNKDKAKRLLRESGYKGEPIRFMTTQEYKWMYDFALLTKQQLEDLGFNIDLQVVDWATLVKRRNNSKEYDAFTTGIGAFYDPTHPVFLTASWPGWTTDEDILKLQAELARETDPKKRMALWEQQTRQFYEKVPVIRYGDLFAQASHLGGGFFFGKWGIPARRSSASVWAFEGFKGTSAFRTTKPVRAGGESGGLG